MARKKRGNGEGSIFQRSDGKWVGRISLGYGDDGRRKTQTVYGAKKRDVQDKLLELQGRKATGTLTDVSTLTVGQYLDQWLSDDVVPNRAARTTERYEGLVRTHLKPRIGRLKLQALAPAHVASMLASMLREDVSADTRKKALAALKTALNRALKLRLIVHNPCLSVETPKVVRRDIHPLTMDQSDQLFVNSRGHRLGGIFVTATTTGLREGELFALHWADLNLTEAVLTVRRTLEECKGVLKLKEPKSKAGRRAVMLSAITVNALKQRRDAAVAEGLDNCELVFPDTGGGFLRRSNFARQVWHPIRKAAGIPQTVTFHDLRHTHASQLLAQGAHIKVVQERLGHSDITLTLNTYSHLLPGLQAEAAGLIDGLFSSSEYTVSTNAVEAGTAEVAKPL
jgi:integrase